MKWFSLVAAVTLIISCFFPWIVVPGKNIVISGVDSGNTAYGKPGYLNLLLSFFYIVFTLVPKLWAKRVNLAVATLNISWTIRNYLILSRCEGGECPEKQIAIYAFLFAGIAMLLGALLTSPGKKINP